jgi:hypothetical protein
MMVKMVRKVTKDPRGSLKHTSKPPKGVPSPLDARKHNPSPLSPGRSNKRTSSLPEPSNRQTEGNSNLSSTNKISTQPITIGKSTNQKIMEIIADKKKTQETIMEEVIIEQTSVETTIPAFTEMVAGSSTNDVNTSMAGFGSMGYGLIGSMIAIHTLIEGLMVCGMLIVMIILVFLSGLILSRRRSNVSNISYSIGISFMRGFGSPPPLKIRVIHYGR